MGRRKKVRLEQIAEAVGSSVVTVSNALNDRKGFAAGLRKHKTNRRRHSSERNSNCGRQGDPGKHGKRK